MSYSKRSYSHYSHCKPAAKRGKTRQNAAKRGKTRQNVADYIETYYNLVKFHSHLDYVSPIEFETNASL